MANLFVTNEKIVCKSNRKASRRARRGPDGIARGNRRAPGCASVPSGCKTGRTIRGSIERSAGAEEFYAFTTFATGIPSLF